MTSTHVQPDLGQEDMSREFSLSFANIVKYMQVSAQRQRRLEQQLAGLLDSALKCSCGRRALA